MSADAPPPFDARTVLRAGVSVGVFAMLIIGLLFALAMAAYKWMAGAAL